MSLILNQSYYALHLKLQRPCRFTLRFLNWGLEKSSFQCYHHRQKLPPQSQRRNLGRSISRNFSNSNTNASLSGQSGGPSLCHFVTQATFTGIYAMIRIGLSWKEDGGGDDDEGGDEHALRSKKVHPEEVTSRRIRRRIDSKDVNMGRSNCARNEITQVGHARVRASGVARARGMHGIVHNLMPSRPKFEEELIKNVDGEAKKAQRKRIRLLSEFYGA
ncbi:hypothetical protein ACFX12_005711 [Malus domestica]